VVDTITKRGSVHFLRFLVQPISIDTFLEPMGASTPDGIKVVPKRIAVVVFYFIADLK